MGVDTLQERITAVRRFDRFFTRQVGALREGLLHSPYSLTEARILFELAQQESLTASDLCRELGLDPGYLSRILASFEQRGLIEKVRSESDGRQRLLRLTPAGDAAFTLLDQRARDEASELLCSLGEVEQGRLLQAMETIVRVL